MYLCTISKVISTFDLQMLTNLLIELRLVGPVGPAVLCRQQCYTDYIWATSWQNLQNDCAPSEDSDQPRHPPSLIRVFAVRSVGSSGPKLSSCGQRRLWSDWVDAQADLSLRWAHTHFVGFVTRRLIFSYLFSGGDGALKTVIQEAHHNHQYYPAMEIRMSTAYVRTVAFIPKPVPTTVSPHIINTLE